MGHIYIYSFVGLLCCATTVATVMPDSKPNPEKVAEVEDSHQSNSHFRFVCCFIDHRGRNFWSTSWRMSTSIVEWKWWKNSRKRARRPIYYATINVAWIVLAHEYIYGMILFCHLEVKGFPFLDRQSSKITEKQATYMKVIVVFNFPVCIFLWLANPTINFEGNSWRSWAATWAALLLLCQHKKKCRHRCYSYLWN